ncbi:MAG: HAMP domain-containing sensor histidine kinase [Deltaproteobacteria bacterium]|jgi:two-component system NtrC family sensor kinase|nr:HAMP domain-containing sensor histidine kinase [Deltaproteobacteria bacterium]
MPKTGPVISEALENENDSRETSKAGYEHMGDIRKAQKELLSRRHFSVKNQIYLGNSLLFLAAMIMVIVLIINNDRVNNRLKFLEFVDDFSSEILQARRYEKNFFLYGTNLNDAIENIHLAESIFITESEQFSELLKGQRDRQKIFAKIGVYKSLLQQLYQHEQQEKKGLHTTPFAKKIGLKLRDYGKDILATSNAMINIEKKAIEKTLSHSRYIHISSFLALLAFLLINTSLLVSRIYSTLNRYATYARRIAAGDFRLIYPRRKFRDEFTDLAVAFNEMIKEIDTRENILIQTHKMKAVGTLTSGIAHELNNPLNNIMLTAHMILEDYHDLSDEERIDMLKDVAVETDRSKKIIRNLLDFARESKSTMESLDLSKLVADTLHLLENQIRFSGIGVDLQFMENFPKINGDVQKLQQVFVNLLLNAIDASTKGNKIQVIGRLGDTSESVKVSVIDHGQGIPKQIQSSIFDPFFTTKVKGQGTGLGLSVSHGIIAKHGGSIKVESEEGSGSCFTITFPIINFPGINTFTF